VAHGEQRLVWLARSGDREAFSELVSLFETKVYRAAYALTGNEQDAKDLSQETFIRAYKGVCRFRGECSFFTWLYRILINSFNSWLRRKAKVLEAVGDDRLKGTRTDSRDLASSGSQHACEREAVDMAYKALSSLPREQKIVMVMRCLNEMTYKEIAQAMRCSIGTVKSRIHAARVSLRRKLLDESDSHRRRR